MIFWLENFEGKRLGPINIAKDGLWQSLSKINEQGAVITGISMGDALDMEINYVRIWIKDPEE